MTVSRRAEVDNPPPFLPPRRPTSLPNLVASGSSWQISTSTKPQHPVQSPPPFLPPRQASTRSLLPQAESNKPKDRRLKKLSRAESDRPTSLQSPASQKSLLSRTSSNASAKHSSRSSGESSRRTSTLELIRDNEPLRTQSARNFPQRNSSHVLRHSSLRLESRPSDDENRPPQIPPAIIASASAPHLRLERPRPVTHPSYRNDNQVPSPLSPQELDALLANSAHTEVSPPPSLPASQPPSRASSVSRQRSVLQRPKPSFKRLSSLDNLMSYRDEKAEWKRASRSSSLIRQQTMDSPPSDQLEERAKAFTILDGSATSSVQDDTASGPAHDIEDQPTIASKTKRSRFRHLVAEMGFCFTIAMTQFMAEYLISGFATELPRLLTVQVGNKAMGMFWPASLLSLILSATLFIFARLSDMYSGYCIFMFGVAWLGIWTLIAGFCQSPIWLDISRAMQGLAIAAFMPSTFTMVGSIYPEGPRRNFVMGLYSGCAPLGFFAGFLAAGALPPDQPQWYFFIAAMLSAITFLTAFLSVPHDRTDRQKLGLKMDWIGAFLIMSGLILVSYALAVEPYANEFDRSRSAWSFPIVSGPFSSGICCLLVAFWYEGWCASCPLLPFDFFKPKSVKAFSLACLCFYASYGIWLYDSAQFFQTPEVTAGGPRTGLDLALWYLPTAVGGVVLCIVGGSLMHIVPIMVLLLISALAWIAAPLLLGLGTLPLNYWSTVLPSMLCATIGIDLTFTVSIVFFSSVQPLRYQGLSGAVCSSLVNLAMSFALSISEIVMRQASESVIITGPPTKAIIWSYKAAFYYAGGSAGLGLIICLLFVRISRSVVREQSNDEERQLSTSSSASTLVGHEAGPADVRGA